MHDKSSMPISGLPDSVGCANAAVRPFVPRRLQFCSGDGSLSKAHRSVKAILLKQ